VYTDLRLETETGASFLKKIADTVKNLNLYLNTSFAIIKKMATAEEPTRDIK
jgi:hypothetical protein